MRLIKYLLFVGLAGNVPHTAVAQTDLLPPVPLPEAQLPEVAPLPAIIITRPDPAVTRCIRPEAVDGDTIRCSRRGKRVLHRLLAIDAPEMPGHCRRGRICAPGDPVASRAALAAMLRGGRVTVQTFGTDRYRRNLSIVRLRDGSNASCAQLTSGNAIPRRDWDRQRRITTECGL